MTVALVWPSGRDFDWRGAVCAIGTPTDAGASAAGVGVSIISRLTDVTMEDGTAGVEAAGSSATGPRS